MNLGDKTINLHVYNSFTRRKEEFIPNNNNQILWYSCGPTVYDASHMGHARSYITFDILRRILSDYFLYDVTYVMNITDIDDKIIKRARQNYLFDEYAKSNHSQNVFISDANEAIKQLNETIKVTDNDEKRVMLNKLLEKATNVVKQAQTEKVDKDLMEGIKETLSEYLDKKFGKTVSDNSIFESLPRYWEEEFHKDMEALNVLPPDVITRVSEYVPEIINYIKQIIDKEYAYESKGSVYFDVLKFKDSPNHTYAKLVPEAVGNLKSLQEGEGDLMVVGKGEKRCAIDFALWKASKEGEPWWESPWGHGRPGWHIECSVMASEILGSTLDIHTGGVDLKFPHHDNELAQAEAYFDNDNWVKYFLHSGHLTISGCKMSKSLKNFITIQDALKKYSARQLRFAFLLHSWKDTLDYSENTMNMALAYEKYINEFFLNVKELYRRHKSDTKVNSFKKWSKKELKLNKEFHKMKKDIHAALCDNIDTRSALEVIKKCITECNNYISESSSEVNIQLLQEISVYITKIMKTFGVISTRNDMGFPVSLNTEQEEIDTESTVMPYLKILSEFRDTVRVEAKSIKSIEILKECDNLRDNILPDVGVRLEDVEEGGPAAIKLVDKEILLREKEEKLKIEQQKEEKKKKFVEEQKRKDEKLKIPPNELFKMETDKYSKFDDKGIPTHDADGKELSKGAIKKLQKLQMQHEKKYLEYCKLNGQ